MIPYTQLKNQGKLLYSFQLTAVLSSLFTISKFSRGASGRFFGGRHRENRQGKDFLGVKGYLEGTFGNPSLVKLRRKTSKQLRKTKENITKTKNTCFSLFFHWFSTVSASVFVDLLCLLVGQCSVNCPGKTS